MQVKFVNLAVGFLPASPVPHVSLSCVLNSRNSALELSLSRH